MLSCHGCQERMLEHLYDLLEADERSALQAHLDGCPDCQAALVRARAQRQLLAAAAKLDFSSVRFTPPAELPATEVLPLVQPTRLRRRWPRWVAAAAVLLAVGLASAGTWFGRDYYQAQAKVERHDAQLAQARQEMGDAERTLRVLPQQQAEKLQALRREQMEKEIQVVARGPKVLSAGAPSTYQIQTLNFNNTFVPAKLSARVEEESAVAAAGAGGPRGFSKALDVVRERDGLYRVTVPPDLDLRADRRVNLVISARGEGGRQAELSERLELSRPVYLTHLATDKPMYQLGETVRFRSLTLDRFSLKPAAEDLRLVYTVTLPSGEVRPAGRVADTLVIDGGVQGAAAVLGPDGKPVRGIGAGEFPLTAPNLPGGEYILSVREEQNRFPEQKRKFLVNKYQKPQLNVELDYNRKTYGPGDEVQAACKATTPLGAPVKDRPVAATVQIDGKTYGADGKPADKAITFRTDAEGKVTVRFKLPPQIERGQASLAVRFEDGGPVQTLVRPIPLVLKKLKLEFYPEGGDLVAGLPARVYFQALTPLGKAADVKGRLLEDGEPLEGVAVETLTDDREPGVNQGMGRFAFTPKVGRKYELRVDAPVGITEHFALPGVKDGGVTLTVPEGVVGPEQPIRVTVRSTRQNPLLVGAYCRGRVLDQVALKPGETEAVLKPAGPAGGTVRVTVFEQLPGDGERPNLRPVAERLIYRRPAERVDIDLQADRTAYEPGQKAKVTVTARNEKGEPAPAVLMVAVVDKSVLTLADEKTARAMPTFFLLTTEVRRPEDLEYADFLLTPHPKAEQALDLLLGTQGWRRFAEQDPAKFRQRDPAEAERYLVMTGQSVQPTAFAQQEVQQVRREFAARAEALGDQYHKAEAAAKAAEGDSDAKEAAALLATYHGYFDKARRAAPPVGGVLLALLMLGALVLGAVQTVRRGAPAWRPAVCYATALASFAGLVVLGALSFRSEAAKQQVALATGEAAPAAAERMERPPLPPSPPGPGGGGARPAVPLPKGGRGGKGRPPLPKAARGGPRVRPMIAAKAGPPAPRPAEGNAGNVVVNNALVQQVANAPRALVGVDKPIDRRAEDFQIQGMGARRDAGPLKEVDRLRAQLAVEATAPPAVVREYAHRHVGGDAPGVRSDFAETLYWHPVLVLPDGKGAFGFDLCDSVTTFQVTAYAHTLDGRLGAAKATLVSRLPFTLQPKVPTEVTASDKIDVPLTVANNSDQARGVTLAVKGHDGLSLVSGPPAGDFSVPAEKSVRKLFRFQPTLQEGEAALTFEGKAGPFADAVRNAFRVVPDGFPVVGSHSDVLERSASEAVVLPESWVKGTLKCQVQVFPSTLADLQSGLEGLLREPHGCFEQASTSNYPNLLILDYLKESDQAKPEVERQAREKLARGYAKLTSFECRNLAKNKREGYEWFGGAAPPHEALTAYGLLQFRDMARVYDVDPEMLRRTRDYLLNQRDGQGGFRRNPRALDSFGRAPEDVTNAYIVWALTESGPDDVTKELDALAAKAKASQDPYFLALVANGLINRARTADAAALLRTVAKAQKEDGHLDAEKTSITGSRGRDLQIETTALAVLGWLKANPGEFALPVGKAVRWVGRQRGGHGAFGSTQSTILALKALIAYTHAHKRTPSAGELSLFVGDRRVASLPFKAGVAETLVLDVPSPEENLKPGKNTVRVEISGEKNNFPYTLSWSYHTLQPASAADCPLRLETALAKKEASEGEAVRLTVKVENVSGTDQGMAVAVVGLPGGLTVPEDMKQLKEYARLPEDGSRPLVSAFEIRGRELVMYWRDLAKGQKVEVPVDLICRVPGEYRGPASRAYLYYNADHKHWVEPLKVTISAKAE